MRSGTDTDVLLVLCPTWTTETPLIAQGYLLAALRRAGIRCAGLDLNVAFHDELIPKRPELESIWLGDAWRVGRAESSLAFLYPDRFAPFDATNEEIGRLLRDAAGSWVERILSYRPRVVGFTVMGNTAIASLMTARELRRQDPTVRVVFGGPGCHESTYEEVYLASGWVDVVVMGEGEQALVELAAQLLEGEDLPVVAGTKVRDGDAIRRGPDRAVVADLETLPIPDYGDFDPADYGRGFEELSVLFSRGCVARCTFCADYPFWGRWRTRTGRAVAEEMLAQHGRHGTREFFFADLAFNGAPKEVDALCDRLLDEEVPFRWGGNARVLPMLSTTLLRKMRRAGCTYLHYGLEHGVQSVLDAMGKGMTVEQYERALRAAFEAGIPVSTGFIAGHPAEGEAEFQGLLDFVARNHAQIHLMHCLPLALIAGAEMARDVDRFDLVVPAPFPLPPDLQWLRGYEYPICSGWQTKDGKNHEPLRVERVERFREFVASLGYGVTRQGIVQS